jgi:predicted dienelactone hydrolase
MTTHRITRTAALALALAAVSAPTAQAQDLRMPDRREASPAGSVVQDQDLRNADQREGTAPQNFRGADAMGAPTGGSPVIVVPAPEAAPASGIDWADVGLGAGGLFGVTLLGLGGTLLVLHRRQSLITHR